MNQKTINPKYSIALFLLLLGMFSHPISTIGQEIVVPILHFPPWIVIEQEQVSGINIEIIKEMASKLDLQIKYKECPWKRCLIEMEVGRADLMSSLLKRPEREVYMYYIEPPYKTRSSKAFYLKKGKGYLLKKYADLYTLKVGVDRGGKYFSPFDDDPIVKKYVITDSFKQLHKLLLSERIDTFIATESSMDYHIVTEKELKGKIEKAPYRYTEETPVYMAISKKSPYAKQLSQFNKIMSQLVAEGKIEKIIENYYKTLEKEYDLKVNRLSNNANSADR